MRRKLLALLTLRPLRRNLALFRTYRAPIRPRTLPLLLFNKEVANFTYEISNCEEIGRFVAAVVGIPAAEGIRYVQELEEDDDLRRRLETRLRARPDRNNRAAYGRRAGWYALARARKPRLLVETGTHDGLGTAVLLRAIERNAAEGRQGTLLSFDIRPDAGWLVDDELARWLDKRIGDARALLPEALVGAELDMFVHDSHHTYEHETFEFETVFPAASPGAVLVSDNAHGGTAFRDFCERHGLDFSVVLERPRNHFYPGAGIGVAVVPGGRGRAVLR